MLGTRDHLLPTVKHRWLISHEHISLPVDIESGSAAKDLVP